jgi:hypothetical protein
MLSLPAPSPSYDPRNEAQARASLERADALNLKANKAADRILLRAPNGSVWAVTVTNSGSVVVTAA